MKTLLIMRHAKSDWSNNNLSDYDRPLNDRGNQAAPRIGKELKKLKYFPDLIISSPANRAKNTALLFAKNNGYDKDIIYSENFYFGNLSEIIKNIQNTDENINTLMVIGHNPTWENLVSFLSEKEIYIEMNTATVAIMTSEINSWTELKEKTFKLINVIRPKELK